jgi:hypothetical protein
MRNFHRMLCREIPLWERRMFELLRSRNPLVRQRWPEATGLGGPTGLTALGETLVIELGVTFTYAAAQWPVLPTSWARRLKA